MKTKKVFQTIGALLMLTYGVAVLCFGALVLLGKLGLFANLPLDINTYLQDTIVKMDEFTSLVGNEYLGISVMLLLPAVLMIVFSSILFAKRDKNRTAVTLISLIIMIATTALFSLGRSVYDQQSLALMYDIIILGIPALSALCMALSLIFTPLKHKAGADSTKTDLDEEQPERAIRSSIKYTEEEKLLLKSMEEEKKRAQEERIKQNKAAAEAAQKQVDALFQNALQDDTSDTEQQSKPDEPASVEKVRAEATEQPEQVEEKPHKETKKEKRARLQREKEEKIALKKAEKAEIAARKKAEKEQKKQGAKVKQTIEPAIDEQPVVVAEKAEPSTETADNDLKAEVAAEEDLSVKRTSQRQSARQSAREAVPSDEAKPTFTQTSPVETLVTPKAEAKQSPKTKVEEYKPFDIPSVAEVVNETYGNHAVSEEDKLQYIDDATLAKINRVKKLFDAGVITEKEYTKLIVMFLNE